MALDLVTGREAWRAAPSTDCGTQKHCAPAQSAAVTVATMRGFDAVNGGKASGGSLDVGRAVVVGGMVFVSPGYGTWGGTPGNVLLAFRAK